MKNYAQAILLFTGYPLEPIVALQIKKSFQLHETVSPANAYTQRLRKKRSSLLTNASKKQKTPRK